jgi:ring-1,2-phenylacetyl-CoA epoxidase subunit PaaC
MTNISLDLLGQTRSYYQYVAKMQGGEATEDTIAFLRLEREYKNVLLVEQPNTDFGYSIARQFLFDVFHLALLEELQNSKNEMLSAIAKKSIKEVLYHTRFSSDWIKRLGDGTEESHNRIQTAINDLWIFTDELFHQTDADKAMVAEGIGVDTSLLKSNYYKKVSSVLDEATLQTPVVEYFQKGGKQGIHSEHMGYILSELQYMQRTYPNMTW